MGPWLLLYVGIAFEVCGSLALKTSSGFEKPAYAILSMACYLASFYFLSLALKTIELGVAYAVWAGCGILITAVASWILWGETLGGIRIFWIAVIVAGVVGLQLASRNA